MGAEILLAAGFGGITLALAGRKFRDEPGEGRYFPLWAGALFLSALTLRLILGYWSEGFSTDMDTFKSWANIANSVGLCNMYRQDIFLDYPPGYLYVLVLLEKLRVFLGLPQGSAAFTLVMKLPSILADLFCGGILLYGGKRKLGEKYGLFLSALYLFCPGVFVNSAQWGQADSFCTALVIASILLLYRNLYCPSALLYGISIACKPQMLIFAPLYLFFALKERKWGKLLLGMGITIGTVLLVALPFTQGFNFLWLLRKYQSTLNYYNYYTVNAYNFWALLGWNWKGLPTGAMNAMLTLAAPVLATLFCGGLIFFSKRREALFLCPGVLMGIMYLFGVKMHERYLFPAFFFLLLGFCWLKDKRLLRGYGGLTAINYMNVAYVLYLFREKGGSYSPNTLLTRLLSALQLLALLYVLYAAWSTCVQGKVKEGKLPSPRPLWDAEPPKFEMKRIDWLFLLSVTLVYAAAAFWRLGDAKMAQTPWAPAQGESAVLHGEETCRELWYLPGLAPDDAHYASRVGVNFQVESSTDGKTWTDCGSITSGYVYAWQRYPLETPGNWVRLTALDGTAVLNEAALKAEGELVPAVSEGVGETLADEQELVPKEITYENSSYFDEIYHARTAYEHILGLEPYENTHPPLGKYFISLGIRMFGLNPFGWRFVGTLFGVMMLPALYFLLKQLLGKPWFCLCGTVLFAFDFMHFTQTRISTIDTYSVFFLLLMYGAMVWFLRRDLKTEGLGKLLPPLLLSGIFTGLGIASKWTAAYGAVGLAVLFFGKLILSLLRESREGGEWKPLCRKCLLLCLWCCLFFLVIPFALYFGAYVPLIALPHNRENLLRTFWSYQTTMFNYHSQLRAEHFFASPWYEWPLDVRPIWYFSQDMANGGYSTISAMGNPLLWWAGIPGLFGAGWLWFREHRREGAVALVGFLSLYLPWMLVPRLTFIYHYFTAVPFLVLALCGVFQRAGETGLFARKPFPEKWDKITLSHVIFGVFTAFCLVLFAVYFPVISGAPTSREYADALELFSTWYFA